MGMLDFQLDDEPMADLLNNSKPNTEIKNDTPVNNPIIENTVKIVNKVETEEIEESDSRYTKPVIKSQSIAKPKNSKTGSRSVGRPATTNKRTIQAKAIPKDLLELARRDAGIPSTVSNSNAIAAYIYMKASDKGNVALSEELKEIIEECNGDNTVQNMNDRITTVEGELQNISRKMDELSLALNYLVLNASGLSYENANKPSDVNLLEEGIMDIRNQIRKQTKELRRYENNNGRPFR